ncbi:hypothetical protein ACF0H5_010259 [Mactra antiquata]
MESRSEPEGTGSSERYMAGDQPPAYEPRGQNPLHVGYDQPTDPRVYNSPQYGLPMQTTTNTVIQVQQPQPIIIAHTRGSDLTVPAICVCWYCCFITGIPAIILAMRAQSLYDQGNITEAERNQRWTRNLMVASVIIHVVVWVIAVLLYVYVFTRIVATAEDTFDNLYTTTLKPW